MGHSLIIKLWQAFVILIAFGAGYWQQMQQSPLVMVIATTLSVLLAGLPLPLIASRPLVMYRIGCRAEELGIKVHKKGSLSELASASTLVLTPTLPRKKCTKPQYIWLRAYFFENNIHLHFKGPYQPSSFVNHLLCKASGQYPVRTQTVSSLGHHPLCY